MKLLTFIRIVGAGLLLLSAKNGVADAAATMGNRHVHVLPMTPTALFPGGNYKVNVDATKMSEAEGPDERILGSVLVGSSFLSQIQRYPSAIPLESSFLDADAGNSTLHEVKMTRLMKTSPRHTDCVKGEDGAVHPKSQLQVGFYVISDNPDAYFEVDGGDDWCIPIVGGTFVTFDGLRPHRTVISAGHVDLLGPFDMKSGKCVWLSLQQPPIGRSRFVAQRRRTLEQQQLQGEASNSSSVVTEITGTVTIFGHEGGIDPNTNATNLTLFVKYDLEGCEEEGSCSLVQIEERTNYCETVNIGDMDDDDGGEEGVVVLDDVIDPQVDSDNEKDGIQSDTYINVGMNVEHFFGLPMVVEDREGHVRGCAIFTQLTADEIENELSNTATADSTTAEETVKNNTDNTPSGASSIEGGAFVSATLVSLVSSLLVIALTAATITH